MNYQDAKVEQLLPFIVSVTLCPNSVSCLLRGAYNSLMFWSTSCGMFEVMWILFLIAFGIFSKRTVAGNM